MGASWRVIASILLLSTATLVLEVSLTRILSIALWYHFAALIIAIALLGFGASGTYLALVPGRPPQAVERRMSSFTLLFAVVVPLGYLASQALPFDPYLLLWEKGQALLLLGHSLALGAPFFAAGAAIGLAFSAYPAEAGRIYFGNLLGSALGCLVAVSLSSLLSGPGLILFAALLGAVASLWLRGGILVKSLLALALTLSLLIPDLLPLRISEYKALSLLLKLPDARLLKTVWDPISRVDVVESQSLRHAPGLSFAFRGSLPRQLGLTIDGNGLTPITHFDGNRETLTYLDFQSSALAYHLKPRPTVLILGPGGGADLLLGLYHGAERLVGVELNGTVVRLLKEDYAGFAGRIYNLPQVTIEVEEGRSYAKRSLETFDIIQLSLLDSFAAASAGVLSGSETYLYTVEAVQDFLKRLNPDGLFSITRWLRLPPRETLRVFAIAVQALEGMGINDPGKRLAFIRSWATGTILIKKSPFTGGELNEIRRFSEERGFDLVFLPDLREGEANRFNRLQEDSFYEGAKRLLDRAGRQEFLETYPFDLSPTTDDRPFFFHFLKWKNLPFLLETARKQGLPLPEWGPVLSIMALLQALFLSVLLILLPLKRLNGKAPNGWLLLYFASLGIGFMFVELSLIQRLILFLGHPTYAISVVLFSLLLFSGLGAYLSGRILPDPERTLPPLLPLVAVLILLYAMALPPLLTTFMGLPKPGRLLLAALLLAPLGLLLGVPFPSGIRIVGQTNPPSIPWAWGANGCASVAGALASPILAASTGFTVVLLAAAGMYLAAFAAIKGVIGGGRVQA